jgi:ABC-type uncharacterized transport system fused permease/ATPase subunit
MFSSNATNNAGGGIPGDFVAHLKEVGVALPNGKKLFENISLGCVILIVLVLVCVCVCMCVSLLRQSYRYTITTILFMYISFLNGAKIGILGSNGTGKSTLMKVLAGVRKDFDGERWTKPGLKIGYIIILMTVVSDHIYMSSSFVVPPTHS